MNNTIYLVPEKCQYSSYFMKSFVCDPLLESPIFLFLFGLLGIAIIIFFYLLIMEEIRR